MSSSRSSSSSPASSSSSSSSGLPPRIARRIASSSAASAVGVRPAQARTGRPRILLPDKQLSELLQPWDRPGCGLQRPARVPESHSAPTSARITMAPVALSKSAPTAGHATAAGIGRRARRRRQSVPSGRHRHPSRAPSSASASPMASPCYLPHGRIRADRLRLVVLLQVIEGTPEQGKDHPVARLGRAAFWRASPRRVVHVETRSGSFDQHRLLRRAGAARAPGSVHGHPAVRVDAIPPQVPPSLERTRAPVRRLAARRASPSAETLGGELDDLVEHADGLDGCNCSSISRACSQAFRASREARGHLGIAHRLDVHIILLDSKERLVQGDGVARLAALIRALTISR